MAQFAGFGLIISYSGISKQRNASPSSRSVTGEIAELKTALLRVEVLHVAKCLMYRLYMAAIQPRRGLIATRRQLQPSKLTPLRYAVTMLQIAFLEFAVRHKCLQ